MSQVFLIGATGWRLSIPEPGDGGTISHFLIDRGDGKFFRIEMNEGKYPHPMIFEGSEPGTDWIGDVMATFYEGESREIMLRCEQEDSYLTPTEVESTLRLTRSSVDNPAQAVKRTSMSTGRIRSNSRRIGGHPIRTFSRRAHLPTTGDVVAQLRTPYDFVANSPDALGKAAILNAIQVDPDEEFVFRLVRQIRQAPSDQAVVNG